MAIFMALSTIQPALILRGSGAQSRRMLWLDYQWQFIFTLTWQFAMENIYRL